MIGMNRLEGTKQAVEAVLRSAEPFFLYLTNQASSDGTGEYFDSVKARFPDRVFVHHESQNTFFQIPNARAFRKAARLGCEYFVALNDDAIIPPEGLSKLACPLDMFHDAAASGPHGGCQELDENLHGRHGHSVHYIEGSCMCIKIDLVLRHRNNLFDPNLEKIYSEDSFESLFALEKGYGIHKVAFDLPHARSQTVNRSPEVQRQCREAQEKNHQWMKRRFGHWNKVRRFDFPIIVKRQMALGDVILTTPLLRQIKKERPLSDIYVETDFPEVFQGNPHVKNASRVTPCKDSAALVIDLNNAYENRKMIHICDGYHEVANEALGGIERPEMRTELFPSEGDFEWARNIAALSQGKKVALIHAGPSHWKGKHWPSQRFDEVSRWLKEIGFYAVCVGSMRKPSEITCDADWTASGTSISQLAALCREASLFVGIDSGPLHIAQAMGTPVAAVFGCTLPRFIFTDGSPHAAAVANSQLQGAGDRHRVVGKTFVDCHQNVMESIFAEDLKQAILKLI